MEGGLMIQHQRNSSDDDDNAITNLRVLINELQNQREHMFTSLPRLSEEQTKDLQNIQNQLRLCRMNRRTVIENNRDHQQEVDTLLAKMRRANHINNNNNDYRKRIEYLMEIIQSGPEHLQMIDEDNQRLMSEMTQRFPERLAFRQLGDQLDKAEKELRMLLE